MHPPTIIAIAALCISAGAAARGQYSPAGDPVMPAAYAQFPVESGGAADGIEPPYRAGDSFAEESRAATAEPAAVEEAPAAAPLALSPPSEKKGKAPASPTSSGTLFTVLGSLAVVIGLFLVVVWISRRALPKAAGALPPEVVDVLGRAPLAPRQTLGVVRFGSKLLLVAFTSQGMTTLGEITDPDEVDRIAGLCRQSRSDSVTATFRQVLSHMGRERPPTGEQTSRAA